MRRIIKLKGEIIFFSLISMVLAIAIAAVLSKKISPVNIQEKAEDKIEDILSKNKDGILKDEELISFIEERNFIDYIFCLTDRDGRVIAGKDYGIKNVDLDKFYNERVNKRFELSFNIGEIKNNPVRNKGYIKINENRIVIYYYYGSINEPDGNGTLVIITFILIFIFFIRGRVKYIVNMSKSIKLIAGGNLAERVKVKYKDELRDLAESINFMTAELEREDMRKKEFITNISHDLRTPLTTIMGYLKIIDEGKFKDEEELAEYLAIINRKISYLKLLLDDFFSYSKLSSKDMDIEMFELYEQELLRQIVDEEQRNFEEKGLELSLIMEENPINIKGNGELLERAINNLLSNALKYSKENTKVFINLKMENSYSVLEVRSTPREKLKETDMERLFERLYKKDNSRSEEGSGLGLTITKEIMKVHNGFVKGKVHGNEVIFSLGIKVNP